jgi:branched-chain amino acid transport system substrate-binding protein
MRLKRSFHLVTIGVVGVIGLYMLLGHSMAYSAEEKTYKIVFIGPLTGPNTSIGMGLRNSIDLYINQVNKSRILPFKLKFIAETDDSKPSVGVAAVQKVCADTEVVAAIAHFNSPVALATGPYFNSCPLLNVVPLVGTNKLTQQGWEAVVRVNTSFSECLRFAATDMVKRLSIKKLAILHSNDDYGNDIMVEIKSEFEKAGGTVVATEGFNVGERDFMPVITKIRPKNPDAIFLGCLATEAGLIARQKKEFGLKARMVGQPGNANEAYIRGAGDAGEGTIASIMSPFVETLPEGPAFLKAYKDAGYKEPIDIAGSLGYAGAQVIVELLRRHGPNRSALVKEVRNLKDFDTLIGKKMYFDASGEMRPKTVGWGILKDRVWRPWDPLK